MFATRRRSVLAVPLAPAARRPRSEAQRQASRLNGAKSRGPRTPEGKRASCLNACKHGLLSKPMTPAADGRGDASRYRKILRQLQAQFHPRTLVEQAMLAALASDLLQLAKIKAMQDQLMRPAVAPADRPTPEDRQRLRTLSRVQRLLDRCRAGQPLACPHAGELAGILADWLRPMRPYVTAARADGIDAAEDYDLEQTSALLERIGEDEARLADPRWLEAVLVGRRRLSGLQRQRLGYVLEDYADRKATLADARIRPRLQRFEHACQSHLANLAREPEKLLLLARYEQTVQHRIERRLALLQGGLP